PLIESNFPVLRYLVDYLIDRGIHITFETTSLSDPIKDLKTSNISSKFKWFQEQFKNNRDDILYSVSPKFPLSCYPKEGNFTIDDIWNYYTFAFSEYQELKEQVEFYYKFVYHPKFEPFIDPLVDS